MKRLGTALALALAPSLVTAAPIGQFSEAFFFGDSYTDGGAAYDLAGEVGVPSIIYPQNQLTNGDVWATQLGATYMDGTYTLGTGFATTNFAVGGAEAVAEPDDVSLDLGTQVGTFLSYVGNGRVVPSNSLGLILIGANDLGEAASRVDPATDPSDFEAALVAAAREISVEVINSIVANTAALLNGGLAKVAVLGLPDLGIFPSVVADGQSAVASAFTSEYNAALRAALTGNFSAEQTMFIDTFEIFDEIISNPGDYGIANTTDPCFVGLADLPACLAADPDTYFFYDTIHPTEPVHTAFAEAVRQQLVTPVPLPASAWFLIAALGGLHVLRRKSA